MFLYEAVKANPSICDTYSRISPEIDKERAEGNFSC